MKKFALVSLVALSPALTLAAGEFSNIEDLLQAIGRLIRLATPIVLGIALLAFFWGLVKFIFNAGDDEEKKKGKSIMIWGAVAFFVMVSIVGIVGFIGDAVDINQGGDFQVPGVSGSTV